MDFKLDIEVKDIVALIAKCPYTRSVADSFLFALTSANLTH